HTRFSRDWSSDVCSSDLGALWDNGGLPFRETAMTRKTVLNDTHRALGVKMVDFGGWDMPIHYGSQIDEHHAVRRQAGMFDVSHRSEERRAGKACETRRSA